MSYRQRDIALVTHIRKQSLNSPLNVSSSSLTGPGTHDRGTPSAGGREHPGSSSLNWVWLAKPQGVFPESLNED